MEVLIAAAAVTLLAAGGTFLTGLIGRKRKALGDPQLTLSTTPYAFGEVVPVRLASVVQAPIAVDRVRFVLRCLESVRWKETEEDSRGRRREVVRTLTETVWSTQEEVAFGRELRKGERFEAETDLRLPGSGGPTFLAVNNTIAWQVACTVEKGDDVLLERIAVVVLEPRVLFVPAGPR